MMDKDTNKLRAKANFICILPRRSIYGAAKERISREQKQILFAFCRGGVSTAQPKNESQAGQSGNSKADSFGKNRNFRTTVSLPYFLNKSTPICGSKPAEHSRMAGLCPCGANVSQFSERMIPVLRYTPLSMTNSRRSDSRAPLRYARNDIFSFVILRRNPEGIPT